MSHNTRLSLGFSLHTVDLEELRLGLRRRRQSQGGLNLIGKQEHCRCVDHETNADKGPRLGGKSLVRTTTIAVSFPRGCQSLRIDYNSRPQRHVGTDAQRGETPTNLDESGNRLCLRRIDQSSV